MGQSRDHSALAVVERVEVLLDEIDYMTFARRCGRRHRVMFLERVRLGTAYPDVVDRVRALVRRPAMAGQCCVALDAMGAGAPVLDMLRRANLGCALVPVTMTSGERTVQSGGVWHVPKRDLVTGLRVMLEAQELKLSKKVMSARVLDLARSRAGWATIVVP